MEHNKIWRMRSPFVSPGFWTAMGITVCLFYFFRFHQTFSFLIGFVIAFTLLTLLEPNLSLATNDSGLFIVRGFKHWSLEWKNIKAFTVDRSLLTITTADSGKITFNIGRLKEKEAFINLLESKIGKNS